jgi:thiol:disulfide interchange protein DsbD
MVCFSTIALGQARGKADVSAVLNVSALRPGDHAVVAVVVDIGPGLHAQSHWPTKEGFIGMEVKGGETEGTIYSQTVYPPGKDEIYAGLGQLNVYEGKTVVYVPLEIKPDAKTGEMELAGTITYQICDDRVCYMPQREKHWGVKTQVLAAGSAVTPNAADIFAGYHAEPTPPTSKPTTQVVEETPPTISEVDEGFQSAWAAFGAAFLAGLLFNVMPCVLPVLPLKAIGFYEVSQHQRAKSVAFGLVFSLGLISVFAILAVLVLVLRVVSWGGLFSHGWFVWTIVIILMGMALGLMDVFTFQLPTAVYNVTPRHDTYVGNFLFGGLTAILATPCTAPLLPPLLIWAASRSAYIGVPAVVMVGVGMASPYMILSAFPEVARRFPRAGAGAELFKQMMAWMLLVAAVYFGAGRLIEGPGFWWAVTAAVAAASLFLIGRTVQIYKGAGALALASVLAVSMVGGTAWWSARLTGLGAGQSAEMAGWQAYSKDAFAAAQKQGKPVLVKFTANWCGTCQTIEGTVFTDPTVWDQLHQKNVVTFKADFSSDNPEAQELLLSLNPSGGIPLTAIYEPGKEKPITIGSVYTSGTLLNILKNMK